MKVLIVSSGNSGYLAPFVKEQIDSLTSFNITFDYYFVVGKGVAGYLSNLLKLKEKIVSCKPDLIHAHYGLSGLLALFVRSGYPLITTFHGNDINPIYTHDISKPSLNRFFSRITHYFSNYSIFVNKELASSIKARKDKSSVIPCQVDLNMFYPMNKTDARKQCNLLVDKRYILFSSSFNTTVKNYPLAKIACKSFDNMVLIELKGYSRQDVNLLLNACDIALIASFNEGSSQFLKEAMASNCPIVSTNVGDAESVFGRTEGCYITSFEVEDVISKIKNALDYSLKEKKTQGRKRIIELELDAEHTSQKVYDVYLKIME